MTKNYLIYGHLKDVQDKESYLERVSKDTLNSTLKLTYQAPNTPPFLIDNVSYDSGLIPGVNHHHPLGACYHDILQCSLNIQKDKPDLVCTHHLAIL